MNLTNALIVAALAASVLLLLQLKQRLVPAVAVAASVAEAVLAFHILKFSPKGINLGLVLGGALVVAGAIIWAKASGKMHVTAAAVVALVGAIQVFTALV